MKNNTIEKLCVIASTLRLIESAEINKSNNEYISIIAGDLAESIEDIMEYMSDEDYHL